jgi:hypothetical protein
MHAVYQVGASPLSSLLLSLGNVDLAAVKNCGWINTKQFVLRLSMDQNLLLARRSCQNMVQELVTVTWRIRSRNPTKSGVQHFKQVTTEPRRELRNHCHILILESILLVLEQLLPAICVSQSTCLTKLIFFANLLF